MNNWFSQQYSNMNVGELKKHLESYGEVSEHVEYDEAVTKQEVKINV